MGPHSKKRKMLNENDLESHFKQLFNEIFDTILMQFYIRFQSIGDFIFVE